MLLSKNHMALVTGQTVCVCVCELCVCKSVLNRKRLLSIYGVVFCSSLNRKFNILLQEHIKAENSGIAAKKLNAH